MDPYHIFYLKICLNDCQSLWSPKIKSHLRLNECEGPLYQSHISASDVVFLRLVLTFSYLEKVDCPDANTSPAVGLQEEKQVTLKNQMPVVSKGLEESEKEKEI